MTYVWNVYLIITYIYNIYIIYVYLRGVSVCQQNGGDIKVASRWYPLDLRLLAISVLCLPLYTKKRCLCF